MQLTSTQLKTLNYAIYCYGGTYQIEDKLLRLFIDTDEFYINMSDYLRFGEYVIYHRNQQRHVDGVRRFHVQGRFKTFGYAIFSCFSHSFNHKYKITNSAEDYKQFQKDVLKYNINN